MATYLSKYITEEEYACGCCGELPPDFNLYSYDEFFDKFDTIREEWGQPININSGYRCPDKNASVGGSPLSVHQAGLALDCSCRGQSNELDDLIESLYPEMRRGKYSTFIHIDEGYNITPRLTTAWREGVRWWK